MSSLTQVFVDISCRARSRRDAIFRTYFPWIGPDTRILDLGSEDGANLARVLARFRVTPANVHIADVSARAVQCGSDKFGYTPVVLSESGRLPFPDSYFDLVYCSSVIEHVTIPKCELWSVTNAGAFRTRAAARQRAFADEIRRVAQAYFVQTPNRAFPIESHTWLPLVGYLSRPLLLPILRVTNRIWIKRTAPDWNLLGRDDMAELFPDAELVPEPVLRLTKSWMAIRTRASRIVPAPAPERKLTLQTAAPIAGSSA
ncbi:MAG: class I SAM-dependent methyltransferase [Steroidobacter sp.]